jgi:hypothetical protein
MNYQKTDWNDEILDGSEVLYDIYKDGELLYSGVKLELNNAITNEGTPVNAARLNNIENEIEFASEYGGTVTFNGDGSITEVKGNGYTKITAFPSIDTVLETYTKDGETVYTKTITFNAGGTITEVIE